MSSSSKRKFDAFKSTGGTSNPTGAELKIKATRTIYALDIAALREIATHAVTNFSNLPILQYLTDPKIADHIDSKYAARTAAKPPAPPKNFDAYSKECWHALNTQHKRLKSSKQFEAAGEVLAILEANRRKIIKEAGPDTVIRHELMKDGVVLGEFMGTMCKIARGFSKDERKKYDNEGLLEKIEELKEVSDDWEADMPDLEDLLGIFGR
ncbi:hypothetical protein BKA61DRAFT_569119 [Leptodontidium sp. MPI-SDFR-AT-0119]|nr:hypothetical protein BKA61DRAFT_569119 [Leptodontidium sp. MPI-SDFR-AT-0119]